jgi:hypothetical protein
VRWAMSSTNDTRKAVEEVETRELINKRGLSIDSSSTSDYENCSSLLRKKRCTSRAQCRTGSNDPLC